MESTVMLYIAIGLVAGMLSGVFGIGGGVVIVPALIYLAGFSQHRATGTSLAVLLPPIGLAGMWEYYRHGNVNVRAAMWRANRQVARAYHVPAERAPRAVPAIGCRRRLRGASCA